jgi:hypothetical protein
MKTKTTIPDKELINFADEFSKKYTYVPAETYLSENQTYKIIYFEGLCQNINSKRITTTPARINKITGVIQLSKKQLLDKNITLNWVFYLIIWCVIRKNSKDDFEADRKTMKYYISTKKSIKDILIGYCIMFENADNEHNRDRFKLLTGKIKKFKRK